MPRWLPRWLRAAALAALASAALGACGGRADNRRDPGEALEELKERLDADFVGQNAAVRTVLTSLQDFLELPEEQDGPLVMHLVGPSGTGKSKLAELIAKSLFDDCDSTWNTALGTIRSAASSAASRLAKMATFLPSFQAMPELQAGINLGKNAGRWLTRRSCGHEGRLENYQNACGVVYRSFPALHSTELDAQEAEQAQSRIKEELMKDFLDAAAQELRHEPGAVLILDDFNNCPECSGMLKELLQTHSLTDRSGAVVSAERAVILFLSDLTKMGLVLDHAETYESALVLVEDAAKRFWGEDSALITKSRHVPFAPLSDLEVIRIVDAIIGEVRRSVTRRVTKYLAKKKGQHSYTWHGRFVCEEHTKAKIIDLLHVQLERVNARAITETFKEKLKESVRFPARIEERLGGFKMGRNGMVSGQDIVVQVRSGPQLEVELELV